MKAAELFSKNLVRFRNLKNLSQRELAKETQLTQRMINHYENQPKSVPLDKLEILAEVLDIEITDFFGEKINDPLENIDLKLLRRLGEIEKLPPSQRKSLLDTIDNYLKANG